MRADAILLSQVPPAPMQRDAQNSPALVPMDQVRQQVAAALFGDAVTLPQVGRFQVAKLLGAGAMGVVYAAHDPQLGRKVALKLLQPLTRDERARARLLREAQAMAQLQHPNVLGVYEAGVHGDQVYVAMEYVEDGTLGNWLRVRARSWQEVVDMLLQAGEGLAAAHAVGLVHRDFKPANILLSAGRARISDFGLARATTTAEDIERTAEDSSGMLLGAPLTRTGALLGTPAYMAPEQLRGEPATPTSDQFAFGVVLYESLYGHRPFQGDSVKALMLAIDAGKLARPAGKVSVPTQVSAVIRRALARDPSRRYESMAALLAALRSARRARVGAWGFAAALTGVLSVGFGGLIVNSSSEPSEPAMARAGDAAAAVVEVRQLPVLVDPPVKTEDVHCDAGGAVCQLDAPLAAEIGRDIKAVLGDARALPSVKDGVTRGIKFFGMQEASGLTRLGFRNGDLIVAVDGVKVDGEGFLAGFTRVLAHGGTLTVDRQGVVSTRTFTVR